MEGGEGSSCSRSGTICYDLGTSLAMAELPFRTILLILKRLSVPVMVVSILW